MEDLKGQVFIQKKLKPYFFWCSAIAVSCLVLLAFALILSKRHEVLQGDEDALTQVKASHIRVRKNMDDVDSQMLPVRFLRSHHLLLFLKQQE